MRRTSALAWGAIGAALTLAQPAFSRDRANEAPATSASEADSQAVETGQAAADSGDYAGALRIWAPLAESGNPAAQDGLASLYRDGHGVARDDNKALAWYGKAADQAYAPAQCNLAGMYLKGLGAPKDPQTAATWFRKSADQGYAIAQFDLGVLYSQGLGLPQDYGLALSWYQKAADQGLAEAQRAIGRVYYRGQGVPKDYAAAARWAQMAADQGNALGEADLAEMYDVGYGVAKDPARALFWYRKAANQGVASAQYNLGLLYADGVGTPKDMVEAYKWVDLATVSARDSAIRANATESLGRVAGKMTGEQIAEGKQRAADWAPGTVDQAPDACSSADIAAQPYGTCAARMTIVANTGDYATIDTKSFLDALTRLKAAAPGAERKAVIADLVAHADRQLPPTLYLLAHAYEGEADHDNALFWAQAAFLRSIYDGRRCTDASSQQGTLVLLRDYDRTLVNYKPTAEKLRQVSRQVLTWDASTPRNYDQRWQCLDSVEAANARRGEAPVRDRIFLPENEWPSVLDKAHATYRTTIYSTIAKMYPAQVSAQPAPPAMTPNPH